MGLLPIRPAEVQLSYAGPDKRQLYMNYRYR